MRTLLIPELLLTSALLVTPAHAGQAKPKIPPVAKPAVKPPAAKPPAAPAQGGRNPNRQVPAEQLDKLLKMSPEDREKALSKLPAPQRQRAQNQIDNLNRLTPAQRQQRIDRLRELEQLPPGRQQAVTKQITSMNGLSVADQREYLKSPGFGQSFSPQEQEIIKERYPAATSDVVRPTDKLIPARHQAVNQEMQRMNGQSIADQREFMKSPAFSQNYSPEEQQIIKDRFKAASSGPVGPTDKLLPARRQAVNQERQRINAMPFEERRQALHSPEFGQNFSPEEQDILRGYFPNAAK